MSKKTGFDRLKGVAATAAIASAGMFGAMASLRAASFNLYTSSSSNSTQSDILFTGIGADNLSYTLDYIDSGYTLASSSTSLASPYSSQTVGSNSSEYLAIESYTELPNKNDTGTLGDSHDGLFAFKVMGTPFQNPDSTIDFTGNVFTSDTVTNIVAGIDASWEATHLDNRTSVRGILTLTNTTGSDITGPVLAIGNMGSDETTTIHATSSGNKTLEDADLWVLSNDNDEVDGQPDSDPTIVFGIQDAASSADDAIELLGYGGGNDDYAYQYNVTVPANSTIRIMNLMHMNNTNERALKEANNLRSLGNLEAAGYLTGLSENEIASIVNYGDTDTYNLSTKSSSSSGILGGGLLLTMLGLAGIRRKKVH